MNPKTNPSDCASLVMHILGIIAVSCVIGLIACALLR